MAQSYTDANGTLIIPSAVASYKVETANSGLSTNGVLMLVGEADAGPVYSLEDPLQDNSFGPDQVAAVIAKYQSGPLVDAFRLAVAPANDPNIVGSPSRIIMVKTNTSTKASRNMVTPSAGTYAALADKSYGRLGNLIYYTVTANASEVEPVIDASSGVTYIPPVGTANVSVRRNGGTAQSLALTANMTPTAFVSAVDALTDIAASGGAARTTIQNSVGTLALAIVSGVYVTITYASGTFTTTPSAGDTLVIPVGSVIDGGAGQENVGAYYIESATSTVISCYKLSDAGKASPAGVPGVVTAPAAVGAAAVSGTAANDMVVYSPVVITAGATTVIPGLGKSIEFAELTTGTDLVSRALRDWLGAGASNPAAFISTSAAPVLKTSATEYQAKLTVNRQMDNITEEIIAGGEIIMKIGYTGTTASMVINDTTMTITVTGGSGSSQTLTLSDYPTVADLVAYIDSLTGYSASTTTAILAQLDPIYLDNGTYTIATNHGNEPGRIKADAYKFNKKVSEESVLVQIGTSVDGSVQAAAGVPAPQALTYLTGGAKGATTDAIITAALLALEKVRGNFLIPLFSRDATEDIEDSLTDAASTYTIDAIHAAARTHVLRMSTLKKRRNRQAFLSQKDTFAVVKENAANIASFRAVFPFQDIKVPNSAGTITQYQPWMGAVNAAAMQAAAFYKAIVHKYANISGAVQAAGDFDDQDDTNVEDALLAGLLPIRKSETGGWYWVSDQTTYGKDNNFVFNSIQATYAADIIALTTAQRMENAFVGQSTADISAPIAKAFLETVLEDFKRLKLIAPSADAPRGYKNVSIRISGTAMVVSFEVKLAGAIYYIPISFLVSQVEQSA